MILKTQNGVPLSLNNKLLDSRMIMPWRDQFDVLYFFDQDAQTPYSETTKVYSSSSNYSPKVYANSISRDVYKSNFQKYTSGGYADGYGSEYYKSISNFTVMNDSKINDFYKHNNVLPFLTNGGPSMYNWFYVSLDNYGQAVRYPLLNGITIDFFYQMRRVSGDTNYLNFFSLHFDGNATNVLTFIFGPNSSTLTISSGNLNYSSTTETTTVNLGSYDFFALHHFAMTYKNNVVVVYIDGVKIATHTITLRDYRTSRYVGACLTFRGYGDIGYESKYSCSYGQFAYREKVVIDRNFYVPSRSYVVLDANGNVVK